MALPVLGIIGALAPIVERVVDGIFPDPKEETKRAELKAQLMSQLYQSQDELRKAQAQIITAEASSQHTLAATWRPITMLSFVAIMINNYIIAPYAEAFGFHVPTLHIPPDMWGLLQIGIGGYIASRGIEKVSEKIQWNGPRAKVGNE